MSLILRQEKTLNSWLHRDKNRQRLEMLGEQLYGINDPKNCYL